MSDLETSLTHCKHPEVRFFPQLHVSEQDFYYHSDSFRQTNGYLLY